MRRIALCLLVASAPAVAVAAGKPISLPKLVSTFMVPSGALPEWSMGATSQTPQITWASVGIETQGCGSFTACRRGTARVSVAGKELQNLRQHLEPVQWDLFMASSVPAKFGPEEISITPLCDTVSCEFDFKKEISGSGIALESLCQAGPAPFQQTAYQLTQGNRRAVAVVARSLGSGGASTSLTLHFSPNPNGQDWCAEARAMQ